MTPPIRYLAFNRAIAEEAIRRVLSGKPLGLSHPPTHEQSAILDAVTARASALRAEPSGPSPRSLLGQALAGSGKTAIAFAAWDRIISVLGSGYRPTAREGTSGTRTWVSSPFIKTHHAHGLEAIKDRHPVDSFWGVSPYKLRTLAKEANLFRADPPPGIRGPVAFPVMSLVEKARLFGLVPDDEGAPLLEDRTASWIDLADRFSIGLGSSPETVISLARNLLQRSNDLARRPRQHSFKDRKGRTHTRTTLIIDQSDMIYIPVCFRWPLSQHSIIIGDEFQDASPLRIELTAQSLAPRSFGLFFGDENQCQPPGTLVTVPDGKTLTQVPIESLRPGDHVQSYRSDWGLLVNSSRIDAVAQRPYSGPLLTFQIAAHHEKENSPLLPITSSQCTPEHKWYVKWTELAQDAYAVYLMRSGSRYRIGKARLFYHRQTTNALAFGPAMRARQEGGDAIWLLAIEPSDQEAAITENIYSAAFGIPQVTFKSPNNSPEEQARIDRFWTEFEIFSDSETTARRLFDQKALLPKHPFWEKGVFRHHGFSKPFKTQATNIFADYMAIPFVDPKRAYLRWQPILSKTQQHYEGPVYSLSVPNGETYVSNAMLTGNSIYAFTGSDIDALDHVRDRFSCEVFPLTTSFRISRAVQLEAAALVPDIRCRDNAPDGLVRTHPEDADPLTPVDLPPHILCRNNAPLIRLALWCLAHNRPAAILGRDDAFQDLSEFTPEGLKAPPGLTLGNYSALLIAELKARVRQTPKARARLTDIGSGLLAICDRLISQYGPDHPATAITSALDALFPEVPRPDALLCLTIHKSKGLEFPHIGILDQHLIGQRAEQEWEIRAEQNLRYVAVTRSADSILYFNSSDCAGLSDVEHLVLELRPDTEAKAPPGAMTWDDLADLYKTRCGQSARTQPMEKIYEWACKQPDITTDEEGHLFRVSGASPLIGVLP